VSDLKKFEQLCLAMANPGFYPHRVSALQRRDTHISVVFLTGELVYKLKKPIDFGFLDYTGLTTRRKMCELEVKLNNRLSRGVYLGVVSLSRQGEEFHFGNSGKVVEYAVKMKQLPDDASLSNRIVSGKATPDEMLGLGNRLAEFYVAAEHGGQIDRYGGNQVIEFNTEENFRQLAPFVGNLVGKERFDFVIESSRGFFRDRGDLFRRRVAEGRICDGHGDLRAEHVYFLDGIQIIDCVEFNERFRCGDRAVDLAFLHMDIERLARPDLSLAVLNGYTESSRDYGIYTLLDFYSCYRAVVRMKISCLSSTQLAQGPRKREMQRRAGQYLDLAFRYAVQFARPTLYVLCGLPGTGKSTYAKRLQEIFDIALLRSDEARRELAGYSARGGPVPFGTGIYRPEMRGRVYSGLLSTVQEELRKGRSAILDATFSRRKWREEAVRLAQDLDANILFFECVSPQDTILERLGRRREGEDGQSDARPEHLRGFMDEFESMDELAPELHTRIDTETEIEANLRTILLSGYSKRRTQVEGIIAQL
jgi:aminoglycoside phosphotransferase family enzyme/predicted kinase